MYLSKQIQQQSSINACLTLADDLIWNYYYEYNMSIYYLELQKF